MNLDIPKSRNYLREFNLKSLFIEELGWDHCIKNLDIAVEGHNFSLSAIAEKRGMVAFTCSPLNDGRIPDYATRRKIERLTAKSVHEHIIIYADNDKTTQIWQWVKREAGKPTACREHTYHRNQPGDSLIQKLQDIAFSLEEEESLTILEVTGRARAAFDIERVTKRFYDRFKAEHDVFLKFINGIPDEELQRWYASVMLNRLMFIYFIQKKGFLDNDTDYLRNKLLHSRQHGKGLFYREVLCPLFFEGFAKQKDDRSLKTRELLGDIPYLNGGLFLKHHIEELHGNKIQIADTAFEKLFDFFDQYQWHLDERLLKKDNEINPDVLGYIFEKYINQKQMGAYYTKEDITEYISKNTVIPFLFDVAGKKCKIAFEGESSLWRLLQSDPDRYIYNAVKHGITVNIHMNPPEQLRDPLPLPPEIEAGIKDVSKRTEWNKAASREYALPTEIWREVVARRQRYDEVKSKMLNGDIRSINDLITYNLDIRQFAQDVIENSEGPELLRAFYHAIENVTVLDPTCGSGAFLFAALNILEPLYETCLNRMQVFLDELERSGKKHRSDKYGDFKKILNKAKKHPNLKYFIFKSIIVKNLYGVDIMEEAIEICKLRLFLKLVAQIEKVGNIEPLPDIDFNIRAGNTLVGFATYDEVKNAVTSKLDFDNTMDRIKEQAEDVDRLFQLFHKQQTELGGEVAPEDKQALKDKLKALEDELNQYLAGEYGISFSPLERGSRGVSSLERGAGVCNKGESNPTLAKGGRGGVQKWLKSHKPFHWFIEFYGILKDGGFDVIIGNPPYVEYSKVKKEYSILNDQFETATTSNLYSYIVERSYDLLNVKGCLSLILPLSAFCTQRMSPLISYVKKSLASKWIAHFGWRPSKLFEGVNIPLSILITKSGTEQLYTTTFLKWYSENRSALFPTIQYIKSDNFMLFDHVIPKIGHSIELRILSKLFSKQKRIESYKANFREQGNKLFYRNTGGLYWRIFTDYQPYFAQNGQRMSSSTESTISLKNKEIVSLIAGTLNSNLYWFFYVIFSSFHHVNPVDILEFPIDVDEMELKEKNLLLDASIKLLDDMNSKSEIRQRVHKGGSTSKIQTFIPSRSKRFVDEIDNILMKHYELSNVELDYIINYDIKYRLADNHDGE